MSPLHKDWKPLPLWWEDAPLTPNSAELPHTVDVVVVGSGYCGMMAGLHLARAGRRVAILDASDPGFGASTRNHGMVSFGAKLPLDLEAQVGEERAGRIRRNSWDAYQYLRSFITDEAIDAEFRECGRYVAAHCPKAYSGLEKLADRMNRDYGQVARMVPRNDQRTEVGSDFYYGGMVVEPAASIHPAKLHRGVRQRVEEAGVSIHGNTEVLSIDGKPGSFAVRTKRGKIKASSVVVATNAYTGAVNSTVFPYVERRVIPVTAYMVATEQLPADVAKSVIAHNRMCADTKKALYAFRLNTAGDRLIFAGRAKFRDISEREAAPILHNFLSGVWPQLSSFQLTHTWKGFVCFTFDMLPHMGQHEGVHYAAGCQGNGVAMMSYLGMRLAQKVLASEGVPSGFDSFKFPSRIGYSGKPWFLPAVGAYYKGKDKLDRVLAKR